MVQWEPYIRPHHTLVSPLSLLPCRGSSPSRSTNRLMRTSTGLGSAFRVPSERDEVEFVQSERPAKRGSVIVMCGPSFLRIRIIAARMMTR